MPRQKTNILSPMKILVIGNGAREHALLTACARFHHELFCTPSNPGMNQLATPLQCSSDPEALAELAQQHAIDLVIVGPEAYLAAGVVDALERRQIPAFGCSAAASLLESDKAWSKAFMTRHHIPTARHESFSSLPEALEYARAQPLPLVIKDAALRAGKGVTIAQTLPEAEAALVAIFDEGDSVVIEEFMHGTEVSVLAITDGERYALLPAAQDHKTIHEGDRGAMTGGMGVICPFPISAEALTQIKERIIEPTLAGLREEGRPFRGVLYAGLMLTPEPKVVEFNARFGDPEAEAILPLIESDFAQHALDAANGNLQPDQIRFSDLCSAVIIMAAPQYPATPIKGIPITLPETNECAFIFHAGTAEQNGQLLSHGGRVLAVTALAPSLPEALRDAYAIVDRVQFEGAQVRRDIGFRIGLKPAP